MAFTFEDIIFPDHPYHGYNRGGLALNPAGSQLIAGTGYGMMMFERQDSGWEAMASQPLYQYYTYPTTLPWIDVCHSLAASADFSVVLGADQNASAVPSAPYDYSGIIRAARIVDGSWVTDSTWWIAEPASYEWDYTWSAGWYFGSGLAGDRTLSRIAVGFRECSNLASVGGAGNPYTWDNPAWGAVLTYEYDPVTNTHTQVGEPLNAPETTDGSGASLLDWEGNFYDVPHYGQGLGMSADGKVLVVSAPGAYDGSYSTWGPYIGRVYTYDWSGSGWTQRGEALTPPADAQHYFGASVAISGNGKRLAVGGGRVEPTAITLNKTYWSHPVGPPICESCGFLSPRIIDSGVEGQEPLREFHIPGDACPVCGEALVARSTTMPAEIWDWLPSKVLLVDSFEFPITIYWHDTLLTDLIFWPFWMGSQGQSFDHSWVHTIDSTNRTGWGTDFTGWMSRYGFPFEPFLGDPIETSTVLTSRHDPNYLPNSMWVAELKWNYVAPIPGDPLFGLPDVLHISTNDTPELWFISGNYETIPPELTTKGTLTWIQRNEPVHTQAGAVWIYDLIDGEWQLSDRVTCNLTVPDELAMSPMFGSSVSLNWDGSVLAVGEDRRRWTGGDGKTRYGAVEIFIDPPVSRTTGKGVASLIEPAPWVAQVQSDQLVPFHLASADTGELIEGVV